MATDVETGSGDLIARFRAAPMSRRQTLAVGVTVALSALDGYDVLAVTFAAPGLAAEWGLSKAALGGVLAAGLAGMALGSLLIAPLADRFGRRPLIFAALTALSAGMLLSGLADRASELSLWRLVTGVSIGTMIAVINPMAAEHASARRQDLAVALMSVGYPIGGVLGGLAAAELLEQFGWRAVFHFGALAGVAMLPLVWFLLPESVLFLLGRSGGAKLDDVNRTLRALGHPPVDRTPEPCLKAPDLPLATLFSPGFRMTTLSVTAIYFLNVLTFYFVLSWLPQLVAERGFSPAEATRISVIVNLGGIVGGAGLGWAAARAGLRRLLLLAFAGSALFTASFELLPGEPALLLAAAALGGLFLFATMIGLYALIARSFPPALRASGTGLVIGLGRAGAALAPALAGALYASGLGSGAVSATMALGAVFALLILAARSPRLGAPGG